MSLTSHTTGGGTESFTGVTELENIGGALYFAAEDGNTETGLWKWNGEEAVFVTSNYNYGNGGNSYVAIAPPTPPTAVEESGVVLSGQTLAGTAGTSGASTGALAGDSGAGTLSISAVSVDGGSAGVVGESLAGTYGHLTLNANGSYSYSADNAGAISNAPAGVLTDTFDFTVSSSNGGTATSSLTISIVGQRVTVSELKTYAALINASAGFQVTVIDTAAKIAAALTSLESEASHIGSIETTDTAVHSSASPRYRPIRRRSIRSSAVSPSPTLAAHITASPRPSQRRQYQSDQLISDNKSIGLDVAQLTSDATGRSASWRMRILRLSSLVVAPTAAGFPRFRMGCRRSPLARSAMQDHVDHDDGVRSCHREQGDLRRRRKHPQQDHQRLRPFRTRPRTFRPSSRRSRPTSPMSSSITARWARRRSP